MLIDISALIPHGEGMVVLDEVVEWSVNKIHGRSHIKKVGDNALIYAENLEPTLLMEYAAQAAAVHAGLVQSGLGERRAAYIGAIKNARWTDAELSLPLVVDIYAESLMASHSGAIYEVVVKNGEVEIFSGRLILNQP